MASDTSSAVFRFYTFVVSSRFVVHYTALSFTFVNIRPLLPGRVLVSPIRPVARLSELVDAEAADLFLIVKRGVRMLERVYKASALVIPLQDVFDANSQSVPHVHIHLFPRQPSDGPDAVYIDWRARMETVGNFCLCVNESASLGLARCLFP